MVVLDPVVIALLALAIGMYTRAVVIVRRRGRRVPWWQITLFALGMACEATALLGPPDALGHKLMLSHMSQHLLLADIGAPLIVAGIRSPVLLFLLPKPILMPLARRKGLRTVFRYLRKPTVAIPIYIIVLYGWHAPQLFEAALRNNFIHVLQHESFFIAGVLVWWSVLEPKKFRVPGQLWKGAHIAGVRLSGMFLGMFFILSSSAAYSGFYGNSSEQFGISPLQDTRIAGGLMFGVDFFIVLGSLAFFFWRAARDDTSSVKGGPDIGYADSEKESAT